MAGPPLAFPLLGTVASAGITSMVIVIALASRQQIPGLAALMAGSTLVYLIQSRVALARESAR